MTETLTSAPAQPAPDSVAALLTRPLTPRSPDAQAKPLGFTPLDGVLGGVRAGELALLGGPPGVGKTSMMLQWARHLAARGEPAIVVCYEHEPEILVQRLLVQVAAELADGDERALGRAREASLDVAMGFVDAVDIDPLLGAARDLLVRDGEQLQLVRGSAVRTGVPQLAEMLPNGNRGVLFVDYLQKVAVTPTPPGGEPEKVVLVVSGLKELALAHRVAVVAAAACDESALDGRRARLHHLRGSSSLAYEADIAMMLNQKLRAVSEVHRSYDPVRAQTFTDKVVVSVEKNRGGAADVDVEFRAELDRFRFDPEGGFVAERLAD